ncbi:MAG: lipid-A-disaccharide synthase [Rhodocyclaceae bacterium]|nr:MAG: lipid-A-disaccharide synthase [Rhodocyclaceae bacterium]
MKPIRIALVAGEASGDLLAAHLIQALKTRLPDARFYGIGGPKMQAQGFEALWPAEKLAVRGYVEVLRHYREITGIRRALLTQLKSDKPDLFIGVDAPDFNLWLETKLKSAGIQTVHFVSPSIWAWRGERIRKIAKAVSRMLALFPFEPPLYERQQIPVSYVGHPLADVIPMEVSRAAARERLALGDVGGPVFALLPGSRQSELQYMAETFIDTGKKLVQRFPKALFLVPLVSRETRNLFEEALWKLGAQDLPFKLLFGHAQDAMAASDAVLVASGTATLEAALLKRPMVIAYKMSPWSWKKMNRMRYQPWVGLPNVLAGRFVVPELLQDDATPENLAQALGNIIGDSQYEARVDACFRNIHELLRQDTAQKATAAILEHLDVGAVAA